MSDSVTSRPSGTGPFDDCTRSGRSSAPSPDAWYRTRKTALLLAVLPRARFRRAFEPGCGPGSITAALAERCDEVVCWDCDPAAVAAVAARLADAVHVRIAQACLPADWPDGQADLVVLSEIGCFLAPDELGAVIRRCEQVLAPGGVLVAAHRRTPTPHYPGGGDDVHARLFGLRGVSRVGGFSDQELRIDVFARPAG